MGRFSKLETGSSGKPDSSPSNSESPVGLPRVKSRPDLPVSQGQTPADYDQGHYLAEGDTLFYQGEYQKALRYFSRAMQVDQSSVESWIGQVKCLIEMKQYKEASIWVLRGLELFPEDPRLVSLQGLTYALNGTVKRAIGCSDYAISRPVPATAYVWAVRGHILSIADNQNAAFCFDKAMEVRAKEDWRTPMEIGLLLLAERKWSRAVEFLQCAVQANQKNRFLWKKLGYASERLGLNTAAHEAYTAALHLDAGDREAAHALRNLTSTSLPVRLWRRLTNR